MSEVNSNSVVDDKSNLSVLQRRKQRILNNNEDRLGLIMGKVDKIEEKPIKPEGETNSTTQSTQETPLTPPKTEEGPISKKLKNYGIGFLILFVGTFVAHFMGYSLLPSEFIEGFICSIFMVVALVIFLIRKLIQVGPSLLIPNNTKSS